MNLVYKFDNDPIIKRWLGEFGFLREQVCIGLALAEKQLFISRGPEGVYDQPRLITYVQPNTWNDYRMDNYSAIPGIEKLNASQLKEFCRAYDSHYFNSYYVPLRVNNGAYDFTKSFEGKSTINHDNYWHFPKLMELVKTLPFEDIGRVFIIYTPPHQKELWHIDYWPGEFYDGTRHFMWLSLDKSLLIDTGNAIFEVDSRAMMFDFSKMHSTPASTQSAISIRVEGQFTKEFCDRHGILWTAR